MCVFLLYVVEVVCLAVHQFSGTRGHSRTRCSGLKWESSSFQCVNCVLPSPGLFITCFFFKAVTETRQSRPVTWSYEVDSSHPKTHSGHLHKSLQCISNTYREAIMIVTCYMPVAVKFFCQGLPSFVLRSAASAFVIPGRRQQECWNPICYFSHCWHDETAVF